jgi:hypothetical protein
LAEAGNLTKLALQFVAVSKGKIFAANNIASRIFGFSLDRAGEKEDTSETKHSRS